MIGSPLRLGPVRLRNRIVFAAHLTNFAVDGLPTDRHVAYYAERAAGGAGLVITEEHSVHPADRPYEKVIRGCDPAVLPAYRRLTAAVHERGAAVFAQLNHNGGQSAGMYSRQPVVAPSPVADPMFREVACELSPGAIAELVASYAEVAARCVEGGFDGVEIQCSQASLLRQFLSPLTNLRTDGYGGPLASRVRIVQEVAAAVRVAVGRDRAVGVRLCGDEGLPGGIPPPEAVETARLLDRAGDIDYVNTTVGVATATLRMVEPPMSVPAGYALPVASAIRRAVRIPVVGVGRFTDLDAAGRAVAEGHCDLVGIVRGQIAEPALAGGNGTRRCVACNQECVGRVGLNRTIGCVVNPLAGRETAALPLPVASRKVLVVGGGPAGLQAAASAAERGHRVVLLEKEPRTGGQLALAATAPGRGELAGITRMLQAACDRSGVEVRTGVLASSYFIQRERPDVVMLATGSRPSRPGWAGTHPGVVDVRDVLDGTAEPSGSVLVYDELGFHHGPSVAELLAARGCAVELMTPAMVVAQDLGLTLDAELFHRRAFAAGVRFRTDRVIVGISGGPPGIMLDVLHHTVGSTARVRHDWVVCAVPPEPVDELWHELRDSGVPVWRVGDCVAPRRADAAIREGFAAGRAVR
ncbi:mycofactocin system FadH/OYE family oxidoreductase 2 [Actinomycetes bacterium KLBMP 9759]